jgi:glycosyltransferase involved in cell wall biosynthesis
MNISSSKTLCLFTIGFPYGKQVETFIESELDIMDATFDKVYIFPSIQYDNVSRSIPSNFEIVNLKSDWSRDASKLLYSNIFLIFRMLFSEFFYTSNKKAFIKNIRKLKNKVLHRLFVAQELENFLLEHKIEDAKFYSYWLNDWTISLGILKKRKKIKSFISRAHGFDIYEERFADKTIPFRYFQLKMVDKVFSVSKRGYTYLKAKNIFPEKIDYSYLGVSDKGVNPFDADAVFTLVSCSNLMPLKRVHLIIEILNIIDFPINWVHFGGGDGNLLDKFKTLASKLPSNVRYEFKGHVSNLDVLTYYKLNPVNLFVLLSESEGLPMSLIEACSFGIPLMATDVGGVSEIVNDSTGILVDANVDIIKVASLINEFRTSQENNLAFRKGVKLFWSTNFNDSQNYKKFYTLLLDS